MYQLVNGYVTISIFIKALEKKYQNPEEHFAAIIDSPASRKWLWTHIKKAKYDLDYQIIQDILQIALSIKNQILIEGIEYKAPMDEQQRRVPRCETDKTICRYKSNEKWFFTLD